MHLSAAAMELLKWSESFCDHVYLNGSGFPTIGYGHRLLHPTSFSGGVSEAEAAEILACDVRDAEQAVQRLVKVPLTQGQFDALVDFCFNLGPEKLAASTLLKILNRGRYGDAVEHLLLWIYAGGEESASLQARREAEAEFWRNTAVEHWAAA